MKSEKNNTRILIKIVDLQKESWIFKLKEKSLKKQIKVFEFTNL